MTAPGEVCRRTALVVVVAEAEAGTGRFRRRHLAETVERGIPPHVTLLVPWLAAGSVGGADVATVAALFARFEPFPATLDRVERFDGHVWLAPEPAHRFRALIEAVSAAYPDHPPYGDRSLAPVPHLTIGSGADAASLADVARRKLGRSLPVAFGVREVTLLEEQLDGRWRATATFPLGARG